MLDFLDLLGAILGIFYIVLEMKQKPQMWLVGMVMPAIYATVLFRKGVYANAVLEVYYFLAAVYGLFFWLNHQTKTSEPLPVRRAPREQYPLILVIFAALWAALYLALTRLTDSNVPLLDSLSTALSAVALWLLSRKYIEQWWVWLVVDAICVYLYLTKGIYFRAGLYLVCAALSIPGYRMWKAKLKK